MATLRYNGNIKIVSPTSIILLTTDGDINISTSNGNKLLYNDLEVETFVKLTKEEYLNLQDKNPTTLYIIEDADCFYLNGVKYGDIDTSMFATKEDLNSKADALALLASKDKSPIILDAMKEIFHKQCTGYSEYYYRKDGWPGGMCIDDFSSTQYKDFFVFHVYSGGQVVRQDLNTGELSYRGTVKVTEDSSVTPSSYSVSTNKMNSASFGNKLSDSDPLPLIYISRCSNANSSYGWNYQGIRVYQFTSNTDTTISYGGREISVASQMSIVQEIKYNGTKLSPILLYDGVIDKDKKFLYIHGYAPEDPSNTCGYKVVLKFKIPSTEGLVAGTRKVVTLTDSDVLDEWRFYCDEAYQDVCVDGNTLYYGFGADSKEKTTDFTGILVYDLKDRRVISTTRINDFLRTIVSVGEVEGVDISGDKLYISYHETGVNVNGAFILEIPLLNKDQLLVTNYDLAKIMLELLNSEKVAAAALNDLNSRFDNIEKELAKI